jgi:hypothetical protein
MPGNSRQLTREAEREFPVRVRLAATGGLGQALTPIHKWLDDNCGADSWRTASGGMIADMGQDAIAFYFSDATLATAFVARWCEGGTAPSENGSFKPRRDAPRKRSELPSYGWKMPWSDDEMPTD